MTDAEFESAAPKVAKKRHPLQTPIRIILFAVLAIFIVALIVDRQARSNANTAFQALNDKLGPEQKLNEISRDEVQKIIGRGPDADDDAQDTSESYSWRGAFRSQVLYVQYRPGNNALLKDVSLNEPPPSFGR